MVKFHLNQKKALEESRRLRTAPIVLRPHDLFVSERTAYRTHGFLTLLTGAWTPTHDCDSLYIIFARGISGLC
jgi:hypothetical protein